MKTTNKLIGKMIFLFVGVLAFTACSPEDGKDGQDGEQGVQGPTGNANVTLYEFEGTYNFANTSHFQFTCDSTVEEAENSLWQGFIVLASDEYLSFSVPGYGTSSSTFYRLYMDTYYGQADMWIERSTGPGETYSKIRIFRILANNTGAVNKTMGDIKLYNGYTEEEVRAMSYEEFVNAFELSVE